MNMKAVDVYVNDQFVRRFSEEDHGSEYEELASQFASAKDRNGEVRPVTDEPITDPARLLPAGPSDETSEEVTPDVTPDETSSEETAPKTEEGEGASPLADSSDSSEGSGEATPESDLSTEDQTSE